MQFLINLSLSKSNSFVFIHNTCNVYVFISSLKGYQVNSRGFSLFHNLRNQSL